MKHLVVLLARAPEPAATEADAGCALIGPFDSDEGPVENYACGDKLCSRLPRTAEPVLLRRQGPFLYALDRNVAVRFLPTRGPSEWAFLYSAAY